MPLYVQQTATVPSGWYTMLWETQYCLEGKLVVAFIDMPLDQLKTYRPDVAEPADFDAFWDATLSEARQAGGDGRVEPWDGPSKAIEISDVTFPGFGGEAIKAWLMKPRGAEGPLPCVVQFIGYNGGRGLPLEQLHWSNAGYVHLLMDTRGQGSLWSGGGATADPHGSGPQVGGFMTKGIERPEDYFYRRFFTDGVRAVDFAASLPEVDESRIAVMGGSQGGGAALAVGALSDRAAAVLSDVPFLCHYRRATTLVDTMPYGEIAKYLSIHRDKEDTVFRTLSYFDGVNFAKRITAPSIVSVALMDSTCPPSTVFAAVNNMPHPPQLEIYPYNGHEGGASLQTLRQINWLAQRFG